MIRRTIQFTTALILCVTVGSCRSSGAVAEGGGHAVKSAQLRAVMSALEDDTLAHWPYTLEGLPDDPSQPSWTEAQRVLRQQSALREACLLSLGLAEAALKMPKAASQAQLSEAERREFFIEARRLHNYAVDLDEMSAAGDLSGMRDVLLDIDQTCTDCHQRFRSFAGDLPRR